MRNVTETPPVEYWQELRELTARITLREKELTPVVYPGAIAVDAWASGELDFDTVGYISTTEEPFCKKSWEVISLTAFDFEDVANQEPKIAWLYELNLTPGKESAMVFPVGGLTLTRFGIARREQTYERALSKQKKAARKLVGKHADFMRPHETEYEFIREQLDRGARGGYSYPRT